MWLLVKLDCVRCLSALPFFHNRPIGVRQINFIFARRFRCKAEKSRYRNFLSTIRLLYTGCYIKHTHPLFGRQNPIWIFCMLYSNHINDYMFMIRNNFYLFLFFGFLEWQPLRLT